MSQIGYDLVLKKAEVQLMCPECCEDPPNIVEEASSGDIACGSCGLVIEGGVVDQRSEWRTFNQDDKDRGSDPNRVGDGGSLLLHGSQLSTLVSFTGDASVQLSKTQASISKNKGNEKLTNMYHSIEAFSSAGRLSVNVIECAKGVAKAAIDNAWFSSFPNEAALAFIFEGTKRAGEPRSLKDMESLAGTKCMKGIKKYVALLQKGLTASGDSITTGASKATSAKDFMPRFAQQIKMPVWVETIAVQIATAILDVGTLGSRSPRNVAASCLYLASHLVSMPKAIAEICPLAQQQKGE
ncbi:hypothetical protein BZA77DRAFT_247862 [Pyronema omphalodes]|nr:hypothetical protein BZA77DRAFT_247862 [Pyronema omphalodes]